MACEASTLTAGVVAIGLTVLVVTVWDIAGSVLGDQGSGGVVTGRIGRQAWRLLEPARRRGRCRSSHLVGRGIALAIPLTWLAAMWFGWTLVFLSSAGNVESTSTGSPASAAEKLYYVGYLLVTLGNGEFQPTGTGWQLASVLAAITGFAVLTLGVTFIVPVIQAATSRRRTAARIALYGTSTAELRRSLEAGDIDTNAIAHEIVALAEAHGAFPVLHYLHTREASRSAPAMIARLALAVGAVGADAGLTHALETYLRWHPAMRRSSDANIWVDVLRSDGRRGDVE